MTHNFMTSKDSPINSKALPECDCCKDKTSRADNKIITCDICSTSVHMQCYMIDAVPSKAW